MSDAEQRSETALKSICEVTIRTEQPVRETLDRCIELAEKVEFGTNTPNDDVTLLCHLKVLRDDLDLTEAGLV